MRFLAIVFLTGGLFRCTGISSLPNNASAGGTPTTAVNPSPSIAVGSTLCTLGGIVLATIGSCPSAGPVVGQTVSPASPSAGSPVSSVAGACSSPGGAPYPGKTLVWDDEFAYTGAPDPAKWNYDQLGPAKQNGEIETYTNALANSQVSNCLLTITAIGNQGAYTSARLGSVSGWTYGRFDIMAKLPCGQGTWPALWMMPKKPAYGGWPNSGELDIMELSNIKADSATILGTEHTAQSGGNGTDATTQVPTDCSAFHLYSMDWEQSQIQILVDNLAYNTYPSSQFGGAIDFSNTSVWPFNQPFYFIFNIAVGGMLGGQPNPSMYPQTMQVQYVRVYQ